jgi:hypothetical protein
MTGRAQSCAVSSSQLGKERQRIAATLLAQSVRSRRWRAAVDRLVGFERAVGVQPKPTAAQAERRIEIRRVPARALHIDDLDIDPPSGARCCVP